MTDKKQSLVAYIHCLQNNPHYRNIWIADVIDNTGSWLTYVATFELVESFSGGSGLALSAVVIIRFLPSLILAPIAGVFADRCNRVIILVLAAIVDAFIVAALVLVRSPTQVSLLFALLFAQFTAIALQDPARKAILPVLVNPSELHLATTLETFSWSITGAVGAALGGALASRLGIQACFLIDAVTYLLAAWFAYLVPRELGDPNAMQETLKKSRAGRERGMLKAHRSDISPGSIAHRDIELASHIHTHLSTMSSSHDPIEHRTRISIGDGINNSNNKDREDDESTEADVLLPGSASKESNHGNTASTNAIKATATSTSMLRDAWSACVAGWSAAVEGWHYMLAPENRDVAALVLMKGCGSITWGAVDVLNVKYSEIQSMQINDSSITLGVIFATVGFGCFIGPIIMNYVIYNILGAHHTKALVWACAVAFCFLGAGAVVMAMARHLSLVLTATLVRALGSSTLWVYSTLLLQTRCPNTILGRVSAAEMAFYTLCEGISSVYGGAAFDVLHLNVDQTAMSLAFMACSVAVAWIIYAYRQGDDDIERLRSGSEM